MEEIAPPPIVKLAIVELLQSIMTKPQLASNTVDGHSHVANVSSNMRAIATCIINYMMTMEQTTLAYGRSTHPIGVSAMVEKHHVMKHQT